MPPSVQKREQRRVQWLAADPANRQLWDWLSEEGDYAPAFFPETSERRTHETVEAALASGKSAEFYWSLRNGLATYGSLTGPQTTAAHNFMQRYIGLTPDAVAVAAGSTEFIGSLGERLGLELWVTRVKLYHSGYGDGYVNAGETPQGHTVIYMGPSQWECGSYLSLYATVTGHKRYQGEAQTYISRPKIMSKIDAG